MEIGQASTLSRRWNPFPRGKVTKIADELRKRFKEPGDVLTALGLDKNVLKDARDSTKRTRLATDSKENAVTPTRIAYLALTKTAAAVNPLLALDAKIDYAPIFDGVTAKSFDAKKIGAAVRAAIKGKTIAKDAELDMSHVASMLNHIEQTAEKGEPSLDESVSKEQHNAMEAAAHGKSNLGIPKDVGKEFAEADKGKTFDEAGMGKMRGFLKEKGLGDADIDAACDMMFKKTVGDAEPGEEDLRQQRSEERGVGDESEEEKRKREEAEKAARDAAMKDGMVTKDQMDQTVKAAINAERSRGAGVTEARDFVRPYVGDIPLAMDSSEQVLRKAAGMLGLRGVDKINEPGLRALIETRPKIGAKPAKMAADEAPLALDSAGMDRLSKKFPGIERISVGG
jgi:hypothetical protein